jgi:hypothetical protein
MAFAERTSRPVRLALYAVAVILTIACMIAVVVSVVLLFGECDSNAVRSAVCSPAAQTLLELLVLGVALGLSLLWIRYLTGVLAIREDSSERPLLDEMPKPLHVDESLAQGTRPMKFGQTLVFGRLDSVQVNRHYAQVDAIPVRFWSNYALRNTLIREGDRGAFVYQKLLIFGPKFILAYRIVADSQVRRVGAVVHGFYLTLSIGGLITSQLLKTESPWWLAPVSIVLGVISALYLVLVSLAKSGLEASDNTLREKP